GYLFERSGRVRYGAVVWLADAASSYTNKNVAKLMEASDGDTSLVVVGSRFLDPALEKILGIKFRENYSATDPLAMGPAHYITREVAQKTTKWWPSHEGCPARTPLLRTAGFSTAFQSHNTIFR